MDFLSDAYDQINWWAIVVATLSTLPIGYIWYDMKIGFGKTWMKLQGLSKEDVENSDSMASTFAMMLLASLITAFFIAIFLRSLDVEGLAGSVVVGIIIGLVFRGGAHIIHNGFSQKPALLTAIDVGHDFVSIVVMTLILGLWL